MTHHLFPLARAENYLRTFNSDLESSDGALRWPCCDGISELAVAPIQTRTSDGWLVSELVTLTHASPALAELSRDGIALLNSLATLSSLVPQDRAGPARLVAKVGIFGNDRDAAERVYAPLLCTEAVVIGWHAARLVRGEIRSDPERSPLRMTNQDPSLPDADFEAVKAMTDSYGFVGSLTPGQHLSVEFPWDPGARTQMLRDADTRDRMRAEHGLSDEDIDRWAGNTSLLQIRREEHPLCGKGILSMLELPFPPDDPDNASMVNELNAWELSGDDLPPQFGAWCIGPRQRPTYSSFMPTQYCAGIPGILINIAVWMTTRQARVRQWLDASRSRH